MAGHCFTGQLAAPYRIVPVVPLAILHAVSESLQQILWNQFGGALQMLENAIVACPVEVWGTERQPQAFWYLTYHTLFWTDYYFSETTKEDFQPPSPFTRGEFAPEGVLPERVYSEEELLDYLTFVKKKSRTFVRSLTPEKAEQRFVGKFKFSLLELAIYNTRHVQHHAAQLNLLLRQRTDSTPGWASLPKQGLED